MDLFKKHITFYSSIILVAVVVFFFISIYFGNNPLNRKRKPEHQLASLFPEGWAFFTKNSTEPRLYVFKVESGKVFEVNLRNFSSEYFFGLSRNNRLLNMQFSNILKKSCMDSLSHFDLKATNTNHLIESIKLDTVKFNKLLIEKSIAPNVTGQYLLAIQKMLPWPLIHKEFTYPSNYTIYPVDVYNHE